MYCERVILYLYFWHLLGECSHHQCDVVLVALLVGGGDLHLEDAVEVVEVVGEACRHHARFLIDDERLVDADHLVAVAPVEGGRAAQRVAVVGEGGVVAVGGGDAHQAGADRGRRQHAWERHTQAEIHSAASEHRSDWSSLYAQR